MVNSNNYEGRNLSKRTCMRYKLVISVVISLLVVALISSFTFDVFAAPRDPNNTGGQTGSSCQKNKDGSETCCWREKVPGKMIAETYCQTCKYEKCTDKELQFRTKQPEDIVAPGGGVFEQTPTDQGIQPPKVGDAVAPKDGGVVTDNKPPVDDQIPSIKNDANSPPKNQRTQSSDSGIKNNK
jgi:hypothetical protein